MINAKSTLKTWSLGEKTNKNHEWETFSKLVGREEGEEEEGNVPTNKILGSLKILAIKKMSKESLIWKTRMNLNSFQDREDAILCQEMTNLWPSIDQVGLK